MKKNIVILLLIFSIQSCKNETSNLEQDFDSSVSKNIQITGSCNFIGVGGSTSTAFFPDEEAKGILHNVLRFTGLPSNFSIMAADVDNACAVISQGKRYILYNQEFMEVLKNETNNHWAETSILAHEIGHHLSGHTLEEGGSRPSLELEADRFSGFVLAKMGATLEEALIAMKTLAPEEGCKTHPSKKARIAAISNGWKSAIEIDNNIKQPKTNDQLPQKINESSEEIYQLNYKLLAESDLFGKSKWELKIMRNEIYARKGYLFSTPEMKSYFENQNWYKPIYDNKSIEQNLTYIEKQNIYLIKSFEK